MTQPEHNTYTRDDFNAILDAHSRIKDFTQFALTRFGDYTRYTEVTDIKGNLVAPVEDPNARTNAGYGVWRLATNWIQVVTNIEAYGPGIPVEHYIAADRGAGHVDQVVMVPLTFIFGDMERDEKYAKFLALKAEFEPDNQPTAPTSANVPEAPSAAAETLDREIDPESFQAAVLLLATAHGMTRESVEGSQAPANLATANRDHVVSIYEKALAAVLSKGAPGLDAACRRVHEAAKVLGLSEDDLTARSTEAHVTTKDPAQEPGMRVLISTGTRKQRLEAARYLFVQSRGRDEAATASNPDVYAYLAWPENRADAAAAYREAMRMLSLPHHSGMGDVRGKVHMSAHHLGLTSEDLRPIAKQTHQAPTAEAPTAEAPDAGTQAAADKANAATNRLGYSLFETLSDRLLGSHDTPLVPEQAQKVYEKARAVLTLSGDDLFGEHTEKVLSVVDDVASLIGVKKKP